MLIASGRPQPLALAACISGPRSLLNSFNFQAEQAGSVLINPRALPTVPICAQYNQVGAC